MILEKNIKAVINTLENMYKNNELAIYTLNFENNTVDIGVYDDFRRDKIIGRYLASNSIRYTSITTNNMNENSLEKIKEKLEKWNIVENELFEFEKNKTVIKIGDVVEHEDELGVVYDIDLNKNSTYPYLIAYQEIYQEEVVIWMSDDEIKPATDISKIEEVTSWYIQNKEDIEKRLADRDIEEECEF